MTRPSPVGYQGGEQVRLIGKPELRALYAATLMISREAALFAGMKADRRAIKSIQAMARARLAEEARKFDPNDPPRWEDDLDFEVLGPEHRDPMLPQDHSYVLNLVPITQRGGDLTSDLRIGGGE